MMQSANGPWRILSAGRGVPARPVGFFKEMAMDLDQLWDIAKAWYREWNKNQRNRHDSWFGRDVGGEG